MKKLAKLFLLLSLVAVLASSLCVIASASTDTVTTFNQLYIGDYEQDSDKYTGMAHVVFGTVSNTETEFGILIETADGKTYKFPGRVIADSGKFGVAIYQLPEGNYKASAYSGTDDNRIVGEPASFTANKATYTLSFDVSKTAGVTAPSVQTIAQGTAGDMPTVAIPASAPANSDVTWVTADGKLFDFDAVLTADTTAYATWCADKKIAEKTWDITGLFGNSTLVDLSDGSSISMEFDVLDCNMGAANYNNYVWIVNSTTYTKWAGYYFGVYGNWALGEGFPVKYLVQNNLSKDGVVLSNNCSPTTMYVKGRSTKITYTAPTESTTGSIIGYNKAIGDTEWTETWSATNLTLANVQDTSKVFMGIDWEGSHSLRVNNLRMYVNDGEYDLPVYSQNASHFTEYIPEYTVTYKNGSTTYSTETVLEGNTATAPDISALTAPLGGIYTWADANGKVFDFDTAIEKDTTIYLKAIADPEVRENTYNVTVTKSTGGVHLMTSVGMDLSAGDTIYLELDVVSSSIRNWHNTYGGFAFWQYLPDHNSSIGGTSNLSGFHDTAYVNNPIHWYQGNTGNYPGTYSHGDHSGANPTLSGEMNPAVIFATGKTVRMAYTAPTDTTNGSIYVYNKDVGADDSTYTLISSVTDLVKASAVTNTSTYAGMVFYTSQSDLSFSFTNYHVYTESYGDIPAMFDYKNADEITKVVPEYTVTYMKDGSTVSSETVQEGNLATAPDMSSYTAPLGGVNAWVDANGNVFDFETSIEKDTTLYFKAIADPAVKDSWLRLTAISNSWSNTLGTSVGMDLSDGSTATMEFDVVEGLPNANVDAGVYLWQYLPTYGSENGYFGGFHDNYFYGNSAYATNSPNYPGLWKTEDYTTTGYTFGEKFRPHEIFATGKTVKAVYTAPTADVTGSIIIYTKAIGAEDSAYAEQASIRGLTTAMAVQTSTTYMGFSFRQSANLGDHLDMTIANYHIYTADGDVPAMFDHNNMVVTNMKGDNTVYSVTTPSASSTAGFAGVSDQTIAYGNSLVYEFKVVESNLSVQDVNSDGDTSDNANVGYVGFGLHSGTVSNWPGKMIFTNGAYSGITNNSFGGTPDYSSSQHWWQLLQTGASVKVVYTRISSASASDGTFVIYRKLEGEADYTQWAAVRDLGDISGSGRINIMYENKGARVLRLSNLATYVVNANGDVLSVVSPLGTNNITFTAE